jgi:hypothetical protein
MLESTIDLNVYLVVNNGNRLTTSVNCSDIDNIDLPYCTIGYRYNNLDSTSTNYLTGGLINDFRVYSRYMTASSKSSIFNKSFIYLNQDA